MLLFDTFLYFNMKLIIYFFQAVFHLCYNSCISIKKQFTGISSLNPTLLLTSFSSHLYTNKMTCKLKKFGNHFTPVQWNMSYQLPTKPINPKRSQRQQHYMKMRIQRQQQHSMILNLIFDELIENMEQMKLKNQKQSVLELSLDLKIYFI